jgi:demethoxyubiquinone hydroxylase (CLK1/Coq7/Cat5 family)
MNKQGETSAQAVYFGQSQGRSVPRTFDENSLP